MSPEKELLIKFYFLAVISLAVVPTIYSLIMPSGVGLDVVSAQAVVQVIPVDGWAWALNTDSAGTNLYVDTNPSGPGWIALTHTTGTPRLGNSTLPANYYGLTFYMTDNITGAGYFEGYIWSPNFGWIEFATSTASGCPSGSCTATVDATGRVHGWARILSIPQAGGDTVGCGDAGGWAPNDCYKGWLKLGWESGDPVNWNTDSLRIQGDGSLTGYAWSNEYGWFKFMGYAGRPLAGPVASCRLTADPRFVRVVRTGVSATTSVSWACRDTNDNCQLSSIASSTQSYGHVATSSFGTEMTLNRTTEYVVACTSVADNSPVSDRDTVIVQYPTKIIECNPNSPDCK